MERLSLLATYLLLAHLVSSFKIHREWMRRHTSLKSQKRNLAMWKTLSYTKTLPRWMWSGAWSHRRRKRKIGGELPSFILFWSDWTRDMRIESFFSKNKKEGNRRKQPDRAFVCPENDSMIGSRKGRKPTPKWHCWIATATYFWVETKIIMIYLFLKIFYLPDVVENFEFVSIPGIFMLWIERQDFAMKTK